MGEHDEALCGQHLDIAVGDMLRCVHTIQTGDTVVGSMVDHGDLDPLQAKHSRTDALVAMDDAHFIHYPLDTITP